MGIMNFLRDVFNLLPLGGSTGGIVVRQKGGVAGTDEIQLYDDGTTSTVETKQQLMVVKTASSGSCSITFTARDSGMLLGDSNYGLAITVGGNKLWQLSNGVAKAVSGGIWGWSSNATDATAAAADTAVARNAAGKVAITDGSSTNYVFIGTGGSTNGLLAVAAGGNMIYGAESTNYHVFYNQTAPTNGLILFGYVDNSAISGARLGSAGQFAWSSNATVTAAAADTGFARSSAAVVRVSDGAAGTGQIISAGELLGGAAAAATSARKIILKKTGIADNTATSVITVTVPNANHAAMVKLSFLSSNGGTDAFESSRTALGTVVLARTSGVDTVAAVATLTLAQIATVSSGATHTLAYGVSAITGASSATQTFDIQVTIDDSGNLGANQVVVEAELINAEATGVTMAAA